MGEQIVPSGEEPIEASEEGQIEEITRLVAEQWSGPLPPPEVLRQYEEVFPGLAQIIIDRFHSAQTHEQEMERERVRIQGTAILKQLTIQQIRSVVWTLGQLIAIGGGIAALFLGDITIGGYLVGIPVGFGAIITIIRLLLNRGDDGNGE